MKRLGTFIIAIAMLAAFHQGCQKMQARCKYCGDVVKTTTLRGVHFDFNKYKLKPEGLNVLSEDINLLKEDSELLISIEGHCDSVGGNAYNDKLSKRRAQTVFNYFLKNGIAADRMRTIGFGKRNPIVPNDTAANRSLNRRVEIKIIRPELR